MAIKYVPSEHHVVRYVSWTKLRKDENDVVLGVLGVAFKLRGGEDYLSTTWLEFFPGTKAEATIAAVNAIRKSDIEVKKKSAFAIGNVARIGNACLNDARKYKIRFVHEPEEKNEAHTALRGWPRDNDLLLNLLAEDAWSDYVLNRDVP